MNKQQEKECFNCRSTKPVSEFFTSVTKQDGFDNLCKVCRQAQPGRYEGQNKARIKSEERKRQIQESKDD